MAGGPEPLIPKFHSRRPFVRGAGQTAGAYYKKLAKLARRDVNASALEATCGHDGHHATILTKRCFIHTYWQ